MAESNRPQVVWGESSPQAAYDEALRQLYVLDDTASRVLPPAPSTDEGRVYRNPEFDEVPRAEAPRDELERNLEHLRAVARWYGIVFEEARAPERLPRRVFRLTRPQRRRKRERQTSYRARRKARVLLRRFCSPEQWVEYARDRRLTVETARSVFVLTQTRNGGVEQTPKSRSGVPLRHQARTWCIHTPYGFPVEDMILAQKLAIETDEEAFLSRANPIIGGMGYGGWDAYDNGRSVRATIDGMVDRVRAVLSRVRIGLVPERGSCCENGETHERSGNWCRRAFSRFFEPIVEEGRLSIEEALEARRANRSPVPIGSERRRE